jgi:hypothetical protein
MLFDIGHIHGGRFSRDYAEIRGPSGPRNRDRCRVFCGRVLFLSSGGYLELAPAESLF